MLIVMSRLKENKKPKRLVFTWEKIPPLVYHDILFRMEEMGLPSFTEYVRKLILDDTQRMKGRLYGKGTISS